MFSHTSAQHRPIAARVLIFTLALVCALLAIVAGAHGAQAAGVVGTGTPGSCTAAALQAASSGGGAISFNCGPAPHTIVINGSVLVNNATVVDGGGLITLDGNDMLQHFYVIAPGNLTVRNITLTRGLSSQGGAIAVELNAEALLENVTISLSKAEGATGRGGAAFIRGELTLRASSVVSNVASYQGGALFNSGGLVVVENSIFHNNGAYDSTTATVARGGAIYQVAGIVDVRHSSITSNAAENAGAGVYVQSGSMVLQRVTLAGNSANSVDDTRGGAIYAQTGTVLVNNSTLVYNRARAGGGIFNSAATVTLRNTIVGDNSAPGSNDPTTVLDCDGPTLLTAGNNIIGDGSCLTGPLPSDRKLTPPLLAPLSLAGSQRIALPTLFSPARDTGSSDTNCLAPDQIGNPLNGLCDVGAVEWQGSLLPIAKKQ